MVRKVFSVPSLSGEHPWDFSERKRLIDGSRATMTDDALCLFHVLEELFLGNIWIKFYRRVIVLRREIAVLEYDEFMVFVPC